MRTMVATDGCLLKLVDYKVQLCNLRGDSMSVSKKERKKESKSRSLKQLINVLSLLIGTEIKKAHIKRIQDRSFPRSYSNI